MPLVDLHHIAAWRSGGIVVLCLLHLDICLMDQLVGQPSLSFLFPTWICALRGGTLWCCAVCIIEQSSQTLCWLWSCASTCCHVHAELCMIYVSCRYAGDTPLLAAAAEMWSFSLADAFVVSEYSQFGRVGAALSMNHGSVSVGHRCAWGSLDVHNKFLHEWVGVKHWRGNNRKH